MDGCRSQAPRWHVREESWVCPERGQTPCAVRPWQASESQEPYRAPNPEDIWVLQFASSTLQPKVCGPCLKSQASPLRLSPQLPARTPSRYSTNQPSPNFSTFILSSFQSSAPSSQRYPDPNQTVELSH